MWTADEIDAENEKYRTEVLADDANAIDLPDSDEEQELDDEEVDVEDEEVTCVNEEVEGKDSEVDDEDEEDRLPPLHMEEELLTSETSDLQELRNEIIERKAKLTIKLPPRRRRHRKTDTSGTQEYASDAEDDAKPLHRKRKHTSKHFSKKPRHHGKVKRSRGRSEQPNARYSFC
ncbi:hypothetical protein DEU56DRAFT_759637 [Suillus clintonianus]|uniref:uncharacterized protein n=1 Tax=Suillus clintonianus TaxID=1904413 RepID=UPI001B86E6AB|nr:uncharacterized protein DEU56DRAFT_759637 [Suillus clintonianus]KAG2124595.1 hypothetical protein DEU56DRAFT_759637 [Suillus clintonianus]